MDTLLGIDIGTTTVCGVAVDSGGELICAVERPNDSAVKGLAPGRAEQEPLCIQERTAEVLRELAVRIGKRSGAVTGIGLTGQMHGMLCVDRTNRPLTPLITWQDGRCHEPSPASGTWLDEMRQRLPERVWESTGCTPASGFMGSTLFWMKRHDELPVGVVRACFIHDWIAAVLTGNLPVTDPSDAGSAGVFDLARMRWHGDIVHRLGFPEDLLPPVRESGEVIGTLTPALADATGLQAGTPVCNAVGDNQAGVIGGIADMSGSVLINLGTGGQISWTIPEFRREPGMETRYLPGGSGSLPGGFTGRFMLVGASLCGGRAYTWLNDVVRGLLGEFGHTLDRDKVYARLNELAAAAVPDCGGLTASTTFAGTRADPSRRGSVRGISLDNFSLANMARAVLAGMVDELCVLYDRAGGKSDCGHTRVVASGNAVRKNPLLAGIIGARTGCPVFIPRHREEAAFGAALVAGAGVGVWPDLDHAGSAVQYA